MKVLYITDLDGTLLNSKMEISKNTVDTINKLIDKGLYFSVATARTSATALLMLSEINIKLPIVLMNGVMLYDPFTKSFLNVKTIARDSAENLFSILKEFEISGFLYTINDNTLHTYYENLNTAHRRNFYEERIKKFGKLFTHTDSFFNCLDKQLVYFSTCDKREFLAPVYNRLYEDVGLNVEFYRDIYMEDFWYLEVSSKKASKKIAVEHLKDKYSFDKIVSFGDNFNDMPMFLASDRCYAVSNAKQEIKKIATKVIGSNDEDAVANFIEEDYELL